MNDESLELAKGGLAEAIQIVMQAWIPNMTEKPRIFVLPISSYHRGLTVHQFQS